MFLDIGMSRTISTTEGARTLSTGPCEEQQKVGEYHLHRSDKNGHNGSLSSNLLKEEF